ADPIQDRRADQGAAYDEHDDGDDVRDRLCRPLRHGRTVARAGYGASADPRLLTQQYRAAALRVRPIRFTLVQEPQRFFKKREIVGWLGGSRRQLREVLQRGAGLGLLFAGEVDAAFGEEGAGLGRDVERIGRQAFRRQLEDA